MAKLAAPYVSRGGGRSKASSAFNEGIAVPQKDWDEIAKRKPVLNSKDRKERSEAITHEILKGELAKYRRR